MKKTKIQIAGIIMVTLVISFLLSSCSVPTACGQTKKQAKAQHKKYQWKSM